MRTLLLVFVAGAALVAQSPPAGPKPLWTVSTGLASPESAYYQVEQLVQAGTVFVPFLFANSVSAYDLYPLIRSAR